MSGRGDSSRPRDDRAAVILCGGLSTRMGRPKALLPFGAETLLQRVIRLCGVACGERVVVAAAGQDLPPLPADVRVVRDERPAQGPLEGLAQGLAACRAPAAYCTPCDVPFLEPGLVALLFRRLGAADAARPLVDGWAQPLPAVYRTTLAPLAAGLVASGRRRVVFLVEGRPVVDVAEAALRAADPDLASFRNCNTPEEYAAALRQGGWGEGGEGEGGAGTAGAAAATAAAGAAGAAGTAAGAAATTGAAAGAGAVGAAGAAGTRATTGAAAGAGTGCAAEVGAGEAASGAPVPLRVEFYGVARSRAGLPFVVLPLPEGATLGDALAALAAALPPLVGPVIGPDLRSLAPGNAASADGVRFLRDAADPLPPGRPLLLLPASSGG